jgi:PBP1b-binding outer membrane lipoprotein LpoB
MKRLRAALGFCILILMVAGCASINYNEIAPNANTFKPKVAVVLPAVKMPEGAEQEVDKVAKAIYDAAVATKQFERVIDPLTAQFQMTGNSGLQDAVMTYTAKLRSLNVSDKESARKIGEIYQADTIIVGDVSKWGYSAIAGEKAGDVGIAIKMVDAETGSVYWKAAHASRKTYSLFKPDLADMAADLSKKIFEYMPKSK